MRAATWALDDRDALGDPADLCESHACLSSEDLEGHPGFSGATNRIPVHLPRM